MSLEFALDLRQRLNERLAEIHNYADLPAFGEKTFISQGGNYSIYEVDFD